MFWGESNVCGAHNSSGTGPAFDAAAGVALAAEFAFVAAGAAPVGAAAGAQAAIARPTPPRPAIFRKSRRFNFLAFIGPPPITNLNGILESQVYG
jgi:hypothetical protein